MYLYPSEISFILTNISRVDKLAAFRKTNPVMGLLSLNFWTSSTYTYRISHQEQHLIVVMDSGYKTTKIP
jgi:hypothetical protein